jgi:type II secretory pathway component PulF
MQIPVIKKLVEQYSLAQFQSAEEAMMEEQKPAIEVEGKDEGECLTHVLASIYIKEKMEQGTAFNQALRDFSQSVRNSIS